MINIAAGYSPDDILYGCQLNFVIKSAVVIVALL